MRRTTLIFMSLIASLMILLSFGGSHAADVSNDEAAIGRLAHSTWDRAGEPISVGPIVVVETYAIADWTKGEMGGRALLQKQSGRWAYAFCSGDALKKPETLTHFGISEPVAILLAKRLAEAEKATDPQRVARFSRFRGLVMMNGAASPTAGSSQRDRP